MFSLRHNSTCFCSPGRTRTCTPTAAAPKAAVSTKFHHWAKKIRAGLFHYTHISSFLPAHGHKCRRPYVSESGPVDWTIISKASYQYEVFGLFTLRRLSFRSQWSFIKYIANIHHSGLLSKFFSLFLGRPRFLPLGVRICVFFPFPISFSFLRLALRYLCFDTLYFLASLYILS